MSFTILSGLGWLHRIEARLVQQHAEVAASFQDDNVYVSAILDVVCSRIQLERIGKKAA